ncbi:MAG TPA: hypothetical protein V6C96_03630, partial [Vampirovibrionales bacterium]
REKARGMNSDQIVEKITILEEARDVEKAELHGSKQRRRLNRILDAGGIVIGVASTVGLTAGGLPLLSTPIILGYGASSLMKGARLSGLTSKTPLTQPFRRGFAVAKEKLTGNTSDELIDVRDRETALKTYQASANVFIREFSRKERTKKARETIRA